MIRKSFRAAALLLIAVTVAACGRDGSIGAVLPGDLDPEPPVIVGGVLAPNGQWVQNDSLLWRFASLLAPPAHALAPNVVPIGAGVMVTLYAVSEQDAADGQIDNAVAISSPQPTDAGGRFTVALLDGRSAGECGQMLQVGTGSRRTRAFVYSDDQDLDAVSEAVVRSLLAYLAANPGVLLCNYNDADLFQIDSLIRLISADTTGTSVADINARVYQEAQASTAVRRLIEELSAP